MRAARGAMFTGRLETHLRDRGAFGRLCFVRGASAHRLKADALKIEAAAAPSDFADVQRLDDGGRVPQKGYSHREPVDHQVAATGE